MEPSDYEYRVYKNNWGWWCWVIYRNFDAEYSKLTPVDRGYTMMKFTARRAAERGIKKRTGPPKKNPYKDLNFRYQWKDGKWQKVSSL